jgi:hypothetical protein
VEANAANHRRLTISSPWVKAGEAPNYSDA